MPEEKVDRLTMQWPDGLKAQVRDKTGARGLTGFVVEAVKAKLGQPTIEEIDSKELGEARDLVQRMADMFVRASDYEDPREQLLEIGLPYWVDTTGWPVELANLVPVEEGLPEPVVPDQDQEDLHRPMFMTGKRTPEETKEKVAQIKPVDTKPVRLPGPVITEPANEFKPPFGNDPIGNDLFSRVQAKAAAAGIDLSGSGLRPASSIGRCSCSSVSGPASDCPQHGMDARFTPATPVAPEPEVPTEPAPDLEVEPDAPSPVTTPATDACPNCGSELVDGECWECM